MGAPVQPNTGSENVLAAHGPVSRSLAYLVGALHDRSRTTFQYLAAA